MLAVDFLVYFGACMVRDFGAVGASGIVRLKTRKCTPFFLGDVDFVSLLYKRNVLAFYT
jgi:hypothetical protein